MDSVSRRLMKELKATRNGLNPEIILLEPLSEEDLFSWKAIISGPPETPYEGGKFKLSISITSQYPMTPPVFTFDTKICHPNIHSQSNMRSRSSNLSFLKTGEVCLDILKTAWSPAWTLQSSCTAISLLLAHPEPGSPLNCDAANLLRCNDILGYNSLTRMYTRLYAMPADYGSKDDF
ncbi:E2 ubiquitin-protein ligase peroxin 4 [Entomophthora muscae]|uniref:E2 ubiquitin-protein ligase peroxin 4 n=1 Tax=Entomophthora muscae TaxID=34485 RepID=A0ACC2TP70_9FUNG|nr:E2 ubiquitin-protein ligase peroxin 4 [Entomophthora muscae]